MREAPLAQHADGRGAGPGLMALPLTRPSRAALLRRACRRGEGSAPAALCLPVRLFLPVPASVCSACLPAFLTLCPCLSCPPAWLPVCPLIPPVPGPVPWPRLQSNKRILA